FQFCGAVDTQKRARSVWSRVRTLLVNEPTSLISLKSRVYRGLFKPGGGPGRNCELFHSRNGRTVPQPGSNAGRNAGGVGIQSPGCEPGVYGATIAASEPSSTRRARSCAATLSPTVMPAARLAPSAIRASDAAYARSNIACWPG